MAPAVVYPNPGITTSEGEEVTVLVTGFGPFMKNNPKNASWEIVSTLPPLLPANEAHPTRTRIVVHPTPVKVAYHTVKDLVPKLLGSNIYDIVLHMGVAQPRSWYALERLGRRSNFDRSPDVDGNKFSAEEAKELFGDSPDILRSTFDCEDVWRRWRGDLADPNVDVRPSDDAGNFLCGFIYYTSLSYLYQKGEAKRPVMFLHVPDLPTDEDVDEGREATVALIRALVDSERQSKKKAYADGPESGYIPSLEKPQDSLWRGF